MTWSAWSAMAHTESATERLYLGLDEIARMLGVSRSSVARLVYSQDGRLPSIRLGGRRLVAAADLARHLEALKTGTGQ